MFRQLEVMYGREPIFDAIKALIGTGGPRALSVDDVRAELALQIARRTGNPTMDLRDYFEGWVRGTGRPSFIELSSLEPDRVEGATSAVAITANEGDGKRRDCAFSVRATDEMGNQEDYLVHYFNGQFVVPRALFSPTQLKLDPKSECMIEMENDDRFSGMNLAQPIF